MNRFRHSLLTSLIFLVGAINAQEVGQLIYKNHNQILQDERVSDTIYGCSSCNFSDNYYSDLWFDGKGDRGDAFFVWDFYKCAHQLYAGMQGYKVFYYGDNGYGDTLSTKVNNGWWHPQWLTDSYSEAIYGDSLYVCFRKEIATDTYIYAWVRVSVDEFHSCSVFVPLKMVIEEYAYCTIPNYPLRVGQKSLNWDPNEYDSITIRPNPTKNTILIKGKDIQQVKVTNLLGQQLISQTTGVTNEVYVNMGDLAQGIYLVTISNKNGDITTSKIIKN